MMKTIDEIMINASIDTVFEVIDQYEKWPEFLSVNKKVTLLETKNNTKYYEVYHERKKGKLTRSKCVREKAGDYHIKFELDNKQFNYLRGEWIAFNIDNRVKLTCIHNFNTNKPFGNKIAHNFFKRTTPVTMNEIRKRAEEIDAKKNGKQYVKQYVFEDVEKTGKKVVGLSKFSFMQKMMKNKTIRSLPLKSLIGINDIFKAGKTTYLENKYYMNSFTPPFPGKSFDRMLESFNQLRQGNGRPISTYIAVTNACPYDCWHCSYKNRIKEKPLDLATMKTMLNQVMELGTSFIGLTGGEPLIRKDLIEIIESIDDRATSVLFTTGFNLTPSYAAKLKKAGLGIPIISLDHYKKEIHDKLRGYEGAFEIAVGAIKMFIEQGFYVTLTLSPTKDMVNSKKEMEKYFDFVRELGVHEVRIATPSLSGNLLGKDEAKFVENEMAYLRNVNVQYNKKINYPTVSSFALYESKYQFGCGAGFHHFFIDHMGNVCPCDVSPLTLGNIKDENVKAIYDRMFKHFHLPGITCYSHVVSPLVMEKYEGKSPLSKSDSLEILKTNPPRPEEDIPLLYKKLGMEFQNKR